MILKKKSKRNKKTKFWTQTQQCGLIDLSIYVFFFSPLQLKNGDFFSARNFNYNLSPIFIFLLIFLCNVRLKTITDYVVFVAFKNYIAEKKRSSGEKTKNKNLFQSDLTFYAFYTTNKNNNNNTRKLFEPGHVSIVVYDKYIFLFHAFISKHTFNVQCPMSNVNYYLYLCVCV